MDTQNTPVHFRLWHRDFWLLALANMVLSMLVYMQIPLLPHQLMDEKLSPLMTGCVMGVFSLGIFVLGGFGSYWVQKYRRNRVCLRAILIMLLSLVGLLLIPDLEKIRFAEVRNWLNIERITVFYIILRLLMGATFALAQIVLCSTLVVDICESFQRTEANHSSNWFGRFGLSLGPVVGLFSYKYGGADGVLVASVSLGVLALVLISMVKLPFKAPDDDVKVFTTDRFILFRGWPLFINLSMLTFVIGLVLSVEWNLQFFVMMMLGFFLALCSERFAFANADLKSDVNTGLISIAIALVLQHVGDAASIPYIVPVFVGFGAGAIGSRFLLFFIKLSNHCQRGTSVSTYILSWEFGLSMGVGVGYALFYGKQQMMLMVALALLAVVLLVYNCFVHGWYIKKKNR